MELKPIESPKAVAQLAKTKFSEGISGLTWTPPCMPQQTALHLWLRLMHPGGSSELTTAPAIIKVARLPPVPQESFVSVFSMAQIIEAFTP